jgi:hypothetical protein
MMEIRVVFYVRSSGDDEKVWRMMIVMSDGDSRYFCCFCGFLIWGRGLVWDDLKEKPVVVPLKGESIKREDDTRKPTYARETSWR